MTRARPRSGRHGGGAMRSSSAATANPRPRLLGRKSVVMVSALGMVATGATMAVAAVTTPNPVSLTAVGATSGVHGFPVWYEDTKTDKSHLRLEQCLDA